MTSRIAFETYCSASHGSRTPGYPPQAPIFSVLASRDAEKRPHSRLVRCGPPQDFEQQSARALRGARAIFASGSPFPPVEIGTRKFVPNQGNNVYIFPAMAMALFATEAERVTDEMFLTAGQAIAEQVSEENLAAELIYPPRERIFNSSLHVAERVAACIFDQGLARVPRPADVGELIRSRLPRGLPGVRKF
jgi:malic enzyme